MPSKTVLRTTYRAIRQQISPAYRHEAAKAAAAILIQQTCFQQSEHVACYYAYKDEFDCTPIIEAVWQAKKKCYLPVIAEENPTPILQFVHYAKGDVLRENRYGILEPENVERQIAKEQLDMVILPVMAFDIKGNRLGTGGGYYDRTFAEKSAAEAKKTWLIGLAYAVQQTLSLPVDKWDICLDGVLTERDKFFIEK